VNYSQKQGKEPEMCIVIGYNRNLQATNIAKRNHRPGEQKRPQKPLCGKQNLDTRLARKQYEDQSDTMFKDSNFHYQISERTQAVGCGGIGAMHKLLCKLKLDKAINRNIVLLKCHVPYWESDHVLNIAYHVLTGEQPPGRHRAVA
jgi:hypothetical protein